MGFNCGIVGLPNVGKSTLFNALTESASADAANYPFCTIEPNSGRVAVPDERLDKLGSIAGSAAIIPTQLEFVDIAGLVKGASKGEGLGNQFLGNIREVDAIIHVVRCFEDSAITHVDSVIDPVRDAETVETELLLADMESVEKRLEALVKKARGQDKEAKAMVGIFEKIYAGLAEGHSARSVPSLSDDERALLPSLQLLTAKPLLYACNVDETSAGRGNSHSQAMEAKAKSEGAKVIVISAAIESEVIALDMDSRVEFLSELGLEATGLARLIKAGYDLLQLITFFTAGPKESRAWTVKRGATAPQAAGVIHTDFEKGFIRAETISYEDYVEVGGESGAKEAGKMRIEGADYLVQDGDVFHFRFNV